MITDFIKVRCLDEGRVLIEMWDPFGPDKCEDARTIPSGKLMLNPKIPERHGVED